jgi:hypothetical protein
LIGARESAKCEKKVQCKLSSARNYSDLEKRHQALFVDALKRSLTGLRRIESIARTRKKFVQWA